MSHSYASKGNRRYRYYVCQRAQKRGWQICPSPSVPAGEIERFVVDQIKAIGRDPAVVAATFGETGRLAEEAIKSLQAERERLRRQLRRDEADIQGLAVRGTMTNGGLARLADLQERVRLGEGRLAEIDRELATLDAQYISEAEVAEKLAAFEPLWESLSPREQVAAHSPARRTRGLRRRRTGTRPLRSIRRAFGRSPASSARRR